MAQKDLSAGQRLTAGLLDGAYPKGVVYSANRDLPRAIPGAIAIMMRLDGMVLEAGRQYLCLLHQLKPTITGGSGTGVDRFIFSLRYNPSGAVIATSPEVGRVECSLQPVMNTDTAPPIMGWIKPDVTTNVGSLGFYGWRVSGSGASPTLAADQGGIWMNVVDMGLAVPDQGTDF